MLRLKEKTFIFDEPLPTPSCHASTLLPLKSGGVLAAWFAGTQEAAPDVMIWVSRRTADGWSAPRCVTPEAGVPHWNPVLFQLEDTTIALYYKIGGPPIAEWKTMVMYSRDEGETWSEPAELVPGDDSGGRGPVKNKAIRLADGTILAPASVERGPWRSFVDISTDDGMTWCGVPIPVAAGETVNMIQPSLWESAPGKVHALMRTNNGRIYRSDSADSGRNWSAAYATSMPNNNSGLDCVRLRDGRLVLLCNPVEADWGMRSPLSVFVSQDNGQIFEKALDLETEPGEFSYPAVVESNGEILLTYTWQRKKIMFCRLEEA